MKSLMPWFCLVATASSQIIHAADGLEAYRQGNYSLAAASLYATQEKDPVANYYLGRMSLFGYGQLKNNELALRYFTKAGEEGYLPAQKLLANYYLHQHNPEQALIWFKKAAAANDISAQMFCTAAYLHGYGVKKNPDMAKRYYLDAAKHGNALAQYALASDFLRSRDNRNKKMGLIWLTKSADKGNARAQLKLGNMYKSGGFVRQDLSKAQELIEKSANQNFVPAMVSLGDMLKKQGNTKAAFDWFNKAAIADNAAGQLALAQLYLESQDNGLAFSWMSKAAQKGSHDAQVALAKMYKDGTGVLKDEKMAAYWTQTAATKASPERNKNPEAVVALWLSNGSTTRLNESEYKLGGIFTAWQNPNALKENNYNLAPQMDKVTRESLYTPNFVMVGPNEIPISDYFNALAPLLMSEQNQWYYPRYPLDNQVSALLRNDSLVLKHDPASNYVDINITYPQETTLTNYNFFDEKTMGWERLSNYQALLSLLYNQAILGDSSAQFELGQLYQYGIGVNKNIEQAITYYQLAAVQQDVRAEYNLGMIYLQGQTNPIDYNKGLEWMTDAAFKGNSYAQYVLANIYENGLTTADGMVVIKPDHQQAMAMFYLSSSNSFGEAEYRLADYLVKEKKTGLSIAAQQNRNQLIKKLYEGATKQGIAEAAIPLAYYYAMDSNPEKQKIAFNIAKNEATQGNSEAEMLLAIMYERGISVPTDTVESMYWYQQAQANLVSEFVLGTYYSTGTGLSKDIDKGKQLLQQSAELGFSYANFNLAILQHQLGQDFLPELNKARELGNSKAGLLLADYYLLEASDPEKMNQAKAIYQYFADKGDKDAQLKLGFLYDRGLGGESNNEMAAHWYTSAANQGQPIAQYLLGQLYQLGRIDNVPNYDEAKKWYEMAKEKFNPAAVALGFIYDTVDDNYSSAAQNFQLAAENGDPIGAFNLGLMYEYGKGMAVDNLKAREWYTKAADKNYASAITQLANLYFHGQLESGSDQQALELYKKAANLNDAAAMYQLGLFSETGVSTKLSFKEAISYYQQAANLGNQKAKLALARIYQYGLGVPKDYQHAADIYKELAENNNAYAQYQLAVFSIDGLLGTPNLEKGKAWLEQAVENGSMPAKKIMQRLSAQHELQISFIEPVQLNQLPIAAGETAERMYLEAMNEWNRGDENLSRRILHRVVEQFPNYLPAKRAYYQLNEQA